MTLEQIESKYPRGAKVRFYPSMFDRSEFVDGEVRSGAMYLSGLAVVKITGVTGFVDVKNLELLK